MAIKVQKLVLPRIYCDSCFFIAIFNNEAGRSTLCQQIVNDAASEKIKLVTSHATSVECSKPPLGAQLKPGSEDLIAAFFDSSFIEKISLEWFVAAQARKIQQKFPVKPYDSIHLATAYLEEVDAVFTYDGNLTKLSNDPELNNLKICPPDRWWVPQKSANLFEDE